MEFPKTYLMVLGTASSNSVAVLIPQFCLKVACHFYGAMRSHGPWQKDPWKIMRHYMGCEGSFGWSLGIHGRNLWPLNGESENPEKVIM